MSEKVFPVAVLGLLLVLGGTETAAACEVCDFALVTGNLAHNAFCRPTTADEVGFTVCTLTYDPWTPSVDCAESGTFCSTITVDSGGGSGGSGGGGGGCTGSGGFCPASCFSCGGGGRPRI